MTAQRPGVRALIARVDAWRFAGQRVHYFEYLHAVLRGMQGRLTIRELFDRDARRYGRHSVRGRLSQSWARTCEASGGDLYATWRDCFPADELALVRAAQVYGNARLLACFEALARHLGLLIEARRILWATLGSAVAAILIVLLLALALPLWTVPSLQHAFEGLPTAYQGAWARALFGFAGYVRRWGPIVPLCVVLLVGGNLFALSRSHGPWRRRLDRFGPWRLYRQVQGLRVLALASILLQSGPEGSSQLGPVVRILLDDAKPWLAAHLRRILVRIDQGQAGAAAFDTGLLDRDLYWYFEDVAQARGLQHALQAVHQRMTQVWLTRIRVQSAALRWGALLLGLSIVLALALWHYAAMDDLRRGWMMFHAGQS